MRKILLSIVLYFFLTSFISAEPPVSISSEEYKVWDTVILFLEIGKQVEGDVYICEDTLWENRPADFYLYNLDFYPTKEFKDRQMLEVIKKSQPQGNIEKESRGQLLKNSSPQIEKRTLQDYLEKNKTSFKLDRNFNFEFSYELVSSKRIEELHQKLKDEAKKLLPVGKPEDIIVMLPLIKLTRVGFNEEMNQALAYIEYETGPLAGRGGYYLLKKINGKWTVIGIKAMWIS